MAINRLESRRILLQMQAVRVGAWGDADAAARFGAALLGRGGSSGRNDQTAAALAAFGLSPDPPAADPAP